jgi:ATP-dependent DNA ligase
MSIKMVVRALARASWQSPEEVVSSSGTDTLFGEVDWSSRESIVTTTYKRLGDIGATAQELRTQVGVGENISQTADGTLSISQVYAALFEIAKNSGEGSQERKVQLLVDLGR